jgi:hypothetical protein
LRIQADASNTGRPEGATSAAHQVYRNPYFRNVGSPAVPKHLEDAMCSRRQALRRLTGKWLHEVSRDPDTASRLPLRLLLTDDNLRCVQALDLYEDYEDFEDRQRGFEMIRKWLLPRPVAGARQ